MEEVFKYIIGLGAAVMMPIIFTILGVCIGIKLLQSAEKRFVGRCRFRWFIGSHSVAYQQSGPCIK